MIWLFFLIAALCLTITTLFHFFGGLGILAWIILTILWYMFKE